MRNGKHFIEILTQSQNLSLENKDYHYKWKPGHFTENKPILKIHINISCKKATE